MVSWCSVFAIGDAEISVFAVLTVVGAAAVCVYWVVLIDGGICLRFVTSNVEVLTHDHFQFFFIMLC